ncbi:uncharacterized protein B0P05DRAFT_532036 [Gilbertella persicaria]|uniref:uncharacterized protein n=1 Tax=Gilbertella persicaria TaxID=101096 RepID=UPI002220B337|nr:uncharacterized protein B0P05DRAFT_532036 [Gilbertella persicaria]KAI8087725.1 hypothetical protein B0P05DRAFT_532036 [Gilbertella persicaria]
MGFLLLIRLSTCMYLITSIVTPLETMNVTARFLSLLIPLAHVTHPSDILPNLLKSTVLLARFVVLYTVLGLEALFAPFKRNAITKPNMNSSTKKVMNQVTLAKPVFEDKDVNEIQETLASKGQFIEKENLKDNGKVKNNDDQVNTSIHMKEQEKKEEPVERDQVSASVVQPASTESIVPYHIETITPDIKKESDNTFSKVEHNDTNSLIPNNYSHDKNNNSNSQSAISLSEKLQQILDQPHTPSPDNHEEPMSLPTPALTPPNQSSAAPSSVSRRSSMNSQHSIKNRFSAAMQKVASRSSSISGTRPPVPPLPVQTMKNNDSAIETSPNKKRFSTLLTRKKTPETEPVSIEQTPNMKPKRSVSTKLQNGFKKSGKRLAKIFS